MNTSEVKVIGSSGQISLGKEFAGLQVIVEQRDAGFWVIREAVVIPVNEMYLHDRAVKASLNRAIAAEEGREPKETDLSALSKKLKGTNRDDRKTKKRQA